MRHRAGRILHTVESEPAEEVCLSPGYMSSRPAPDGDAVSHAGRIVTRLGSGTVLPSVAVSDWGAPARVLPRPPLPLSVFVFHTLLSSPANRAYWGLSFCPGLPFFGLYLVLLDHLLGILTYWG